MDKRTKSFQRVVLLLWWLLLIPLPLLAQQGLEVGRAFDGRYQKSRNAVEVSVKGSKLKPYGLTVFRSLTLRDAPADFNRLSAWVEADGKKAVDKEVGLLHGRLYYGFYRFRQNGKVPYRYLFFRNTALRDRSRQEVTVVYMEGSVSIAQLKKMFK